MKTVSWRDTLKRIEWKVIIGIVTSIVTAINAWQVRNIQKKQMEIELQQAEWEQQQRENELTPTMKVSQKGSILLGKGEYTKYELYNSENNLAGGRLKDIDGVVMVECENIRVKTLWIKDAIYNKEIPFDADQQCATIFFKEQRAIENEARILQSKINECLQQQGADGNYEFDLRLGIIVTLEYSDGNNVTNEQRYIVYLGEVPYCKVVDDGTIHCDQYYYLKYGKEEQGEEYEKVIYETAERIRKESEGN